jgi:hypothetical protein
MLMMFHAGLKSFSTWQTCRTSEPKPALSNGAPRCRAVGYDGLLALLLSMG